MPLPRLFPSSGRREGPKKSSRTTPMSSSSLNPRLPMGYSLSGKEDGNPPHPRGLTPSLTGSIHTAQEAAQMPGQRNDADAEQFNHHAVTWQRLSPPPRAEVHPPDEPDHGARHARQHQVQ